MADRKLYLCVDAGGTAVKLAVSDERGEIGRAEGPPCNIKGVGAEGALRNILKTTFAALQNLPQPLLIPVNKVAPVDPEMHLELFERVWLGIAGILRQSEVDAFRPLAAKAFGFTLDDDRLRITNDGHLLAAPAVSLPHIESTVVLVAGTGSVSLAFKKEGTEMKIVGLSGGWGFLIGDEGSAFCVGKLAMRRLMLQADASQSQSFQSQCTPTPLLPLFASLLERLEVSDPAEMIDRIYSSPDPASSTFSTYETRSKLWIADSSRVVFRYAFEDAEVDSESGKVALSILDEAIQPLVDATIRLLQYGLEASKSSLSLGGGLWNSSGYKEMLLEKLNEKGVKFSHVAIVRSAAEEGVKALRAMDRDT
ncbi:uncharacterized protein JCM6883_002727 [Sporobolomyces salmoneus]|uniref:uncharacterized protein n=1 Tax=Sporobolomyces salmoneus TaxID=183962 RepID=UPI00316EC4EB